MAQPNFRHAINSNRLMPIMSLLARLRELHRSVAPFVLAPLLVTVFSGVRYRLARDWFGASRDQVHWLMVVHEGEWLGFHPGTGRRSSQRHRPAVDADHRRRAPD